MRAQLEVDDGGRMKLTAFTPLNTPGITIFADGDAVTYLDHGHETAWRGSAREFAKSFGFFAAGVTPADMALLILGEPAHSDAVSYERRDGAVSRATVADVVVTYDSPAKVTVARGNQRLEIEQLERVATTDALRAPDVPAEYVCCPAPKL